MPNSVSEFDDLLQQAQCPVLGYMIRLTGSVHDAQDLLQAANVTAIGKQSAFTTRTNFVGWLRQIAVNHYRNQLRKQAVAGSVALVDESLGEVIERRHRERLEQEREQTDWRRLSDCLERLPGHQRETVKQFYLGGQSLNELAESTGRNSNAVGQTLHRARLALIQCVKNSTGTTAEEGHSPRGAETR